MAQQQQHQHQSLKCRYLHKQEITLPNCRETHPEHCNRVYYLYIPSVLCRGGAGTRRRLLLEGVAEKNHGSDNEDGQDNNIHHRQQQQRKQQQRKQHRRRRAADSDYFEGGYHHVGTLPMVFAIHGLGDGPANMGSMEFLIPYAESRNFLLVLPQGIENSFNAGTCCGYAKQNNIHDVDYLVYLQNHLTRSFTFIESEFAYGIGYSNGAFLLTYAMQQYPHLFRAIVPVSGYTHDFSSMEGMGIGMMLHHSLDDSNVRPSGCCKDPKMPSCHDGIEIEMDQQCTSVLNVFDSWARIVNQCDDTPFYTPPGDIKGNGAFGSGGMGESKPESSSSSSSSDPDVLYLLSFFDDETIFSFKTKTNDPGPNAMQKIFSTKMPVSITYNDAEEKVTCLTSTSANCIANTTMCLYSNKGHFDNPNFGSSFLLDDEVFDFIARDACEINDGIWLTTTHQGETVKSCDCLVTEALLFGGVYCLDALNADGTYVTAPVSASSGSSEETVSSVAGAATSSAPGRFQSTNTPYDNKQLVGIVGSLFLMVLGVIAAGFIKLGRPSRRQQQEQYTGIEYNPSRGRGVPDSPLFCIERGGIGSRGGGYRDYFGRVGNTNAREESKFGGYGDKGRDGLVDDELPPIHYEYGTEMVARRSSNELRRGSELEEHSPPYSTDAFKAAFARRHDSAPGRILHNKVTSEGKAVELKDMLMDIKGWKKKRSQSNEISHDENLHRKPDPDEYDEAADYEEQNRSIFKNVKEWSQKRREEARAEAERDLDDDSDTTRRTSGNRNQFWDANETDENPTDVNPHVGSNVDDYDYFFNDKEPEQDKKEELKEIESYYPDP